MNGHCLVVDDDAEIRTNLTTYLAGFGWQVSAAADGGAMRQVLTATKVDAIVLDLMLPGEDGLALLRWLGTQPDSPPVLMLTARGDTMSRVVGLELGADDYVTKPFSIAELIARINAIFRRQARMSSHADETFTIGTWTINARKHTMSKGRTSKRLTFYELEVLKLLRERSDETVSRDELLEKVWGIQASPTSRTVDNFIVKLRKKIEERPDRPVHILTVYGFGYKLVP